MPVLTTSGAPVRLTDVQDKVRAYADMFPNVWYDTSGQTGCVYYPSGPNVFGCIIGAALSECGATVRSKIGPNYAEGDVGPGVVGGVVTHTGGVSGVWVSTLLSHNIDDRAAADAARLQWLSTVQGITGSG